MTDASTARPVLSGRYELHRRIARGGMADVFLARDQLLDRPVAVKVLFPQYAAEPTFVARFRREAQAAANLNHPSVVAVYDWGSHEDTYFIVMEYVEGRSLADVLASEGHLHPDRAAEVATDVAAALGFAHRNGTVHRDVKPGNIMITPAGQVKVTDFGIARAFGGGDDELTQTGSVMGTASYFSPEQAQGKPVDPRSDLYSLGVVLFEMVTGEPPFNGASPVLIAYKHVQEAAPAASSLNPSVPPPLEAIINRLLAKNPDQRYAAAEDVRADLRRFREGHPLVGSAASHPTAYPPPQNAIGAATTAMARPEIAQTRAETGQLRRPLDTGSSRAIIDTTRAVPASAAVRQAEPVEEYYEPPSRTGVFLIMLAGLLLLLIGLIFYISQAIGTGENGEDPTEELVAVPDVVGERETTAKNTLREANFEFDVVLEESDLEEPGMVFRQDPASGTEVKPDWIVTIFVSKADEQQLVPNVVGLSRAEASTQLDASGFAINTDRQSSDDVPLDDVISQSPEPNEKVNAGSEITIVVSTGPEQQEVPPLTGQTTADASAALNDLGFEVNITRQSSSDVQVDRVIETRPAAGSVVDLGTPIEIIVSQGAGNAQVPLVKGLAEGAAVIQLNQAGFRPKVEYVDVQPDSGNVGNVVSQSPEGNQNALQGSEVVIRVGRVNENGSNPDDGG